MTTLQILSIAFGIFVAGLFIGCNLGVVLMAVLAMSGRSEPERVLSYPVELDVPNAE